MPESLRKASSTPRYRQSLSRVRRNLFTRLELLGHASVETTQIYTHVMKNPGLGVHSPLDQS